MLPVEAQAARVAPTSRAWLKAADMPLSLKLPEGFIPSYCRNRRPGVHADVAGHAVGGVQQRLAFADGDALLERGEGQQVVEPPHAAEAVRIAAPRPFLLEVGQATWARAAGPSRRPRRAGCRNGRRQPESHRWRTLRGRRAKYTADRRRRIWKWFYLLNGFKYVARRSKTITLNKFRTTRVNHQAIKLLLPMLQGGNC